MIDKQLFRLLGGNKKYIIYTVASQLLGLLANLAITASICAAIFLLIAKAEIINYIYPALVALIAIFIRYITSRLTGYLRDFLGRKVKKDLRNQVYNKILKLGIRSTEEMSMAGLTQLSVEGVEQLDLYYSSYLPQFFFSMLAPLILFAITVGIDWRVALVLIACVPLIPLSIIAVSRYAKRIFAKYWGRYTSMGDTFLDNVQGLKELKIFRADEARHHLINRNAEDFRKITMKILVMQLASTTLMDLVAFGGAGIGIVLAVLAVIQGLNPAIGLFLILIAVEFFLPLRAFGSAFHIAMNGVSAGKRIIDLLDRPEPEWGQEAVDDPTIVLKDVFFCYEKTRKVLSGIDMVFPPAGLTAIVGESGCGKSTVVKLILGTIRPTAGRVLIGDHELDSLDRDKYYSRLSMVSYNTYIFNITVRENFMLAADNVSEEAMWEALVAVDLADYIRANGGLDKLISEDAGNISGGQKQRLALAINLVADKDIYIFDEATSNIDIDSEAIIMRNIESLSCKKNVIMISHRLANAVRAEKIYFIEGGRAEESGTHQELLRLNGGYANLYRTQKNLEEGYLGLALSQERRPLEVEEK